MSNKRGFSLIELLIVVAIILIIAAIAIPNLMRSRIAANDSAAAASVRTINTAEATYQNLYSGVGYGPLSVLGPGAVACPAGGASSTNACILDGILGCSSGSSGAFCTKDAFKYTVTINSSGEDYVIFTEPLSATQGDKDYCSDPDMIVRMVPDPGASGSVVNTDSACTGGLYNPI
jgi:type IV pilus assembly protein PilA